jgi:hypothetical protein
MLTNFLFTAESEQEFCEFIPKRITHPTCAGMGLNGFIFRKIIKNKNIREKKNPGSRLGFAC